MHKEVEARFIGIDYDALKKRLDQLGATDRGTHHLQETVFFDKELSWNTDRGKFVRVRKIGSETLMTFKHNERDEVDGTKEIELTVDDYDRSCDFLREVGLVPYRRQEKRRHSYAMGEVRVDIDFWPRLPPYAELEGPSEAHLKEAAARLGFNWVDADFHNAAWVIENVYSIPFRKLRSFMFDETA